MRVTNLNVAFVLEPDDLLAERYRKREEISQGLSAGIFLADDVRENRKVILKSFGTDRGNAYLRETKSALDVKHKNLLCPLDFFYDDDGSGYVVYEYFSKGSVWDRLEAHGGAMPAVEVIQCARDLLTALDHLHSRKIIHCDLKPDNVFLRESKRGLEFVLGDLGSTCTLREASSGIHRSGTPAYAAPERLHDKFHYNSDLYSLGVMLFQLISGKLPFSGGPGQVAREHLNTPVPMEWVPQCRVRDLIAGLLEKDPARRFQEARSALALLNNPDRSPTVESTVEKGLSLGKGAERQRPIRGDRLQSRARQVVDFSFSRAHLFVRKGAPLVVLEGATEFLLLGGLDQSFRKILTKTGPIRPLSASCLAYLIESTCFVLDVETAVRTPVGEQCTRAIDYAVDSERLFWRSARTVHMRFFDDSSEFSALVPHFLLEAHSVLRDDGQFAISSGPMNSQVGLYDRQCRRTNIVELGAPIVRLIAAKTSVMAVCLAGNGEYDVWNIPPLGEARKIRVPQPVSALCSTPGHLFWLCGAGNLMQSHITLQPRSVAKLPEQADGLVVSADHAWLLTWHKIDTHNTKLVLYENGT